MHLECAFKRGLCKTPPFAPLSETHFFIHYKARDALHLPPEVSLKTMDMRRYRHFYYEYERYLKIREV